MSAVQSRVNCVRGDADVWQITDDVESIRATVSKIVAEAKTNSLDKELLRLESGRERLVEAGQRGRDLADSGVGQGESDWRLWAQSLPPIAFEIAREAKELAQRAGRPSATSSGADEFS